MPRGSPGTSPTALQHSARAQAVARQLDRETQFLRVSFEDVVLLDPSAEALTTCRPELIHTVLHVGEIPITQPGDINVRVLSMAGGSQNLLLYFFPTWGGDPGVRVKVCFGSIKDFQIHPQRMFIHLVGASHSVWPSTSTTMELPGAFTQLLSVDVSF